MLPHHLAIEIVRIEAGAGILSNLISLRDFLIDRFALFVNNLLLEHTHPRDKRWNRVTTEK
jgi:hypothetical protein